MTLVLGGSGILGMEIVRRLCAAGESVRVMVRPETDATKRAALEKMGAKIAIGDLKDAASLKAACQGVTDVISTASSTLSRAAGDNIDTVDKDGQVAAVKAAAAAGVKHFVLMSFPEFPIAFPLQDAKRAAEAALKSSGMAYTIVQTPHFMEVWCSPALGFDVAARKARIFGAGTGRMNWVSMGDVAAVLISARHNPAARNKTLTFGGPHAVSQLDVVKAFEAATGAKFELEHVPLEALQAQYAAAEDPLHKSFAALMLICATGGWEFDHAPIKDALHTGFTSVHDLAKGAASR